MKQISFVIIFICILVPTLALVQDFGEDLGQPAPAALISEGESEAARRWRRESPASDGPGSKEGKKPPSGSQGPSRPGGPKAGPKNRPSPPKPNRKPPVRPTPTRKPQIRPTPTRKQMNRATPQSLITTPPPNLSGGCAICNFVKDILREYQFQLEAWVMPLVILGKRYLFGATRVMPFELARNIPL